MTTNLTIIIPALQSIAHGLFDAGMEEMFCSVRISALADVLAEILAAQLLGSLGLFGM